MFIKDANRHYIVLRPGFHVIEASRESHKYYTGNR